MPAQTPRTSIWHSVQLVLAAAAIGYAWLFCLSFDPTDWPSPKVYPHPPTQNWGEWPGAWSAFQLFYFLGDGVWPLLLGASFLWWASFRRWAVRDFEFRVIGVLLLVAVTAASVAWMAPTDDAALPEGNGGVLGIVLVDLAHRHLSDFMAAALLVCTFVVGVLLAADNVVTGVPSVWQRLGAWRRRPRAAVSLPQTLARPPEPTQARTPEEERSLPQRPVEPAATPPPEVQPTLRVWRPQSPDLTENSPRSQPTDWPGPPLHLLDDPQPSDCADEQASVRDKGRLLARTLNEFGVDARVVAIETGPVLTLFELALAPGVKISQVFTLANDLAVALRTPAARVVAPLPGKNTIGIELPNSDRRKVRLKELLCATGRRPGNLQLPLFVGMDAAGKPLVTDLADMPHCLIAGTTGAGKSVCVNSLILSLLMTCPPQLVKLILIDPKIVELGVYAHVPHLMCPMVLEVERAVAVLEWATRLMDERYALLADASVRHIRAYNEGLEQKPPGEPKPAPAAGEQRTLPYVIIVIDELADLMLAAPRLVEGHLCRLAQKSRAVGIHLVVATQRPEVKVVTGLIKSNLPARIAFRVASRLDSRIVLDQNGAEALLGSGDMLFLPAGAHKPTRVQGTYVGSEELRRVVDFLAEHGEPQFHPDLGSSLQSVPD